MLRITVPTSLCCVPFQQIESLVPHQEVVSLTPSQSVSPELSWWNINESYLVIMPPFSILSLHNAETTLEYKRETEFCTLVSFLPF